jgi:transcriptional regulator with XRE-family HTH domain
MTQTGLAEAAKVGQSTVIDFEKERRQVAQPSVDSIRAALEGAGIEFISENGGGAGVRLRKG